MVETRPKMALFPRIWLLWWNQFHLGIGRAARQWWSKSWTTTIKNRGKTAVVVQIVDHHLQAVERNT